MSKKTLTFTLESLPIQRFALLGVLLVLAACSSVPPTEHAEQRGGYSDEEQARLELIEQQYVNGEYKNLLASLDDDPLTESDGVLFRSDALKYQAFSHCSLGDTQPCRASFRQLLETNPGYQLTAAEHSHPQWGPIFADESRKVRSTRIWIKQE